MGRAALLPAVRARNGVEEGMIRNRGGETGGEWGAEDGWMLIEGQREQQKDAHVCLEGEMERQV